jgi:hypothetical protein
VEEKARRTAAFKECEVFAPFACHALLSMKLFLLLIVRFKS